jgi:hypothetical protein
MRKDALAVFAFVGCLNAGQAKADNLPCDFFQNAVIGTRCAATIGLTAGLDYSSLKASYAYTDPNQSARASQNSDNTVGSLAASWTPTNWFTLSFSSGYDGVRDSSSYQTSFYGIYLPQTFSGSSSSSYSHVGSQTLVGNFNVYDSGPGSQRLVLNAFVGGSYAPSFTANLANGATITNASDTVAYGGFTAYETIRISQDYSVTPSASTQLDHNSNGNNNLLYASARVLISNDQVGIAVGPVVQTAYWLSSDDTPSHGSSQYSAGGSLVYQPFRASSTALLNGIILEGSALHSLGQAAFINQPGWKADEWSFSGTAAVHFRY